MLSQWCQPYRDPTLGVRILTVIHSSTHWSLTPAIITPSSCSCLSRNSNCHFPAWTFFSFSDTVDASSLEPPSSHHHPPRPSHPVFPVSLPSLSFVQLFSAALPPFLYQVALPSQPRGQFQGFPTHICLQPYKPSCLLAFSVPHSTSHSNDQKEKHHPHPQASPSQKMPPPSNQLLKPEI